MYSFSKSVHAPASNNSKLVNKSKVLILPTLLALALSACSSTSARFDVPAGKNAATVQQSTLQPLGAPPQANAQPDSQFTASIVNRQATQSSSNSWMGSRNPDTYRVSTGDTLYSISRKFGLTVEALRSANNMGQFTSLRIGQQILLPRQNTASASPRTYVANQPAEINTLPQSSSLARQSANPVAASGFAPVQQAAVKPAAVGIYTVQPKDTLYSIARAHGVHVNTIKNLNGFSGAEGLRIGQQIRVGGASASAQPQTAIAAATAQPAPAAAPKAVVIPKPDKRSSSRFRWPVNGRVISEFGKKSDGRRNDGLNVAVPPGTVVKAAENGVVVYAGNAIKSYGNLILVKHDGGWVTTYAHNGSILVKKGDKVRRGQAIARSGQSGDVAKPQLHFEIRRGALAVDPRKYLSSK